MKRTKKLTLGQAREEAKRQGLIKGDYFAQDTGPIWDLMRRTSWRQSPSSAAMGRSRGYSFYLALQAKSRARR